MRHLVAGGAGFIGSHLIDALLEQGGSVVCIDNLSLGSEEMIAHHSGNPEFHFIKQDINDTDALDEVFRQYKIDRIYHMAANSDIQKSAKDPDIDYKNTFLTTVSILNAMRNAKRDTLRNQIPELLFASTSAVYGDKTELLSEDTGSLSPVSYYGAAKLSSEAYISAYSAMNGIKANIIRFPNVVGPRLTHGVIFDFIAKLRKNPSRLEILGDGNQNKPYLYVTDLVEAMLSVNYDSGVDIFNAGVESSTTVRTIADIVCDEMGLKDVEYIFTGGTAGWLGDVPRFQYDLSKIHAHGWRAKHTSDEAVRLAAKSAVSKVNAADTAASQAGEKS